MEGFVEKSLLYDFYGELLTEHQKQMYEAIHFGDYSEAEVARDAGISRQGVHDLMRRCDQMLARYESRLHLVEKFLSVQKSVREIQALTEETNEQPVEARLRAIRDISSSILEEL